MSMSNELNKKCTKCGEIKRESDFHKNKSRKDGLNSSCKECRSIECKARYAKDSNHQKMMVRNSRSRMQKRNNKIISKFLKNNKCNKCNIYKDDVTFVYKLSESSSYKVLRQFPDKYTGCSEAVLNKSLNAEVVYCLSCISVMEEDILSKKKEEIKAVKIVGNCGELEKLPDNIDLKSLADFKFNKETKPKPLFNLDDLKNNKFVAFICCNCDSKFEVLSKDVRYAYNNKHRRRKSFKYCEKKCQSQGQTKKIKLECCNDICQEIIEKTYGEIKSSKSGKVFCSSSCSASFSNRNKSYGSSRSKLESGLEDTFSKNNPDLDIIYNSKKIINSELDMYFPELNTAIEINGILHYKPIYGDDKLNKIKHNDLLKKKQCLAKGIRLIVIDDNNQPHSESKVKDYYQTIIDIVINNKPIPEENI